MDRKINRLIDLTQKEMKGDTVKQKLEKNRNSFIYSDSHHEKDNTQPDNKLPINFTVCTFPG